MIRAVSDDSLHATPEDWRILRGLGLYRLLLVTVQLVLYQTGWLGGIFDQYRASLFYYTCVAHALLALVLILPIVYRRPGVSAQAHIQFAVDAGAITLLALASGGVPSGLGMLLLASAVGCSMVTSMRMALVQAAGATILMFAEEAYRLAPDFDAVPYTQTGILGLMFFATSLSANTVARRARRSEALVARVGSDLASLARLNESVIEHMQTGVLVVNADGRIRLLNAAGARLAGVERDEVLAVSAPGLAAALADWRGGALHDALPVPPRGGFADVVPRFSRLGWGESAPVLVLLEPAQALREQALQINLAALGRLSAGIAHEIRNPLSAISHAGQLLAESPDIGAENQRLLTMIQRHSARIDRIVGDVLALSKREAPTPSPIRLRAWLEQAVAHYREAHPTEAGTIRFDRVAPDFTLYFDESHLQQVLFNLWDNSFKHGARDGRPVTIDVATGSDGSLHWFEVSDNGAGIPAELAERVFEPFFSTSASGTGLGLYLARELCEYNRVRLAYRAGSGGAAFRFTLAAAAKEAA